LINYKQGACQKKFKKSGFSRDFVKVNMGQCNGKDWKRLSSDILKRRHSFHDVNCAASGAEPTVHSVTRSKTLAQLRVS